MQSPRTKPVLRWPGGKSRLLPEILPILPPHGLYCEPFAGGLAVLLAKAPSRAEVINDLNGDLVALYRCAQFHPDALVAEMEFHLGSRENLTDFKAQPGLTDLQRAARFLAINKASFAGNHSTFAVSRTSPGIGSRANVLDSIRQLNRRLDRVAIEHLTWQRCLGLYDGPDTLFFLDPPYLAAETHIYHGWREADMEELAATLSALKGRWVLTVDDSAFNRRLFAAHHLRPVTTRNGLAKASARLTFGELIIHPHGQSPAASPPVPRSPAG
ncbi:MAG: DNA adenine methylase [Verrucomicrobiota bacterium]